MSNVPKLRFKEFSGEWEKKTIGDVSKIFGRIGYRGYTVEDIVQKGDGAIALSPGNFVNNRLNIESSTYISWFKYEESPEIMIENGDILFVKTGSTYGKTAFVTNLDENATINPQIVVLKEINMNNTLLSYIVSNTNIKKQVERIVVGGAIPTMSQKELAKMKFYLPSKQEQEKIALFFTSIDTKIEQLSKKEELLQQYKKGVMQKIFNQEIRFKKDDGSEFCDWEEKKLGDICKLQGGFAFKSEQFRKSGIPIIRISNISNINNYIDRENIVYYDAIPNDRNFSITNGDLIVAMSGATTGKASIYNLNEKAYLNQRVGLFRANKDKLYYGYLVQFVFSKLFYRQLDTVLVAGAQPNISSKDIEDFKFNLPCLKEQIKIANFLSSIDSKIEQVQQHLNSTKEFKKALLQQMFV